MLVTFSYLSTSDNPFNPFDDYENWENFDKQMNYDSNGKVARLAKCSSNLSISENAKEKERTIDRIIELGINPMFIKVQRAYEID